MTRTRLPKESWPSWYHSPGGDKKVFNSKEEVPDGWTRKKPIPYEAPEPLVINVESVLAQLGELGIPVDPRWGAVKLKKVLDEND